MSTVLSVNLNAIAQLRNRRDLPWPSVVNFGRLALAAGAGGLTVHPRPDERHIRRSDVPELRALIDDEFPDAEFNIEGYPTDDFLTLCEENQPEQVTLVPDDPAQATSDHGWDFRNSHNFLTPIVARLKSGGARVALFSDPDAEQMRWARDTGCHRVELFTGPYGATFDDPDAARREIDALGKAADAATECGMTLNAGHDLTVENLPPLIARIPQLAEVSIGHGLTADALEFGMSETVRRFIIACSASTGA
ncbi:MAG: pyridoxine 5'-phosphate synthase [Pseudomonadota bacterium]